MKTSWKDLTLKERMCIGNGCGARRFFRPPWKDIFTASCDQHDFYYARGCMPWHKLKADIQFFKHMVKDSLKTGWQAPLWIALAFLYFLAVHFFGHFGPFSYGFKFKTKEEIIEIFKD